MRAVAAALAACAVVSATGCAHHVVIDRPPAASAPAEVRAAYFEDHALRKARRDEYVARTRLGDEHATFSRRTARLKNGLPIERVEDLRPLVPDDSQTARAIDAAVEARGQADGLTGAGAATACLGIVVGAALVGLDLGVYPGTAQVPEQEAGFAPPLIAGGIGSASVGVLVGGALIVIGSLARDVEDDATTLAFARYDEDLRRALALPVAPETAPPADATPADDTPDAPPGDAPPADTAPAPDRPDDAPPADAPPAPDAPPSSDTSP